jgi:molybdopterin molybdotransferase
MRSAGFLAEDITAPRDVPLADNSAVDGYAFRFTPTSRGRAAFSGWSSASPPVIASDGRSRPWGAARIFTGAVMPPGADTVAMQEDCDTHRQDGRDFVIVPQGLKTRRELRGLPARMSQRDPFMLTSGERLRPRIIAAIASTGKRQVDVYRKGPGRAGVDRRRAAAARDTCSTVGDVFDSNHFLLRACARGWTSRSRISGF